MATNGGDYGGDMLSNSTIGSRYSNQTRTPSSSWINGQTITYPTNQTISVSTPWYTNHPNQITGITTTGTSIFGTVTEQMWDTMTTMLDAMWPNSLVSLYGLDKYKSIIRYKLVRRKYRIQYIDIEDPLFNPETGKRRIELFTIPQCEKWLWASISGLRKKLPPNNNAEVVMSLGNMFKNNLAVEHNLDDDKLIFQLAPVYSETTAFVLALNHNIVNLLHTMCDCLDIKMRPWIMKGIYEINYKNKDDCAKFTELLMTHKKMKLSTLDESQVGRAA